MNIEQICRREIVTIDESASLHEAASQMRGRHVGALVVTRGDGAAPQAVGIVTDRDLAIEALARDLAVADVTIGRIASDRLVAVPRSAGIAEAVNAMQQAGVRRLLVTTEEGELVGFVSADDILDAIASELGGLAGAMRSGIARETAQRRAIAAPAARPVFLPLGTPGMPWPVRAT